MISLLNIQSRNQTMDYIEIGIAVALLSLSGKISFPIGVVPVTAQMLVVYFLGMWLSPRESFSAGVTWLFLGIGGVPVFAPGFISPLLSPSFGYIVGMVIGMPLAKLYFQKYNNALIACIICYVVNGFFGCIWLHQFLRSWYAVWLCGIYPFILVECFKMTMAISFYRSYERKLLSSL